VSLKYLLPCRCGRQIVVEAREAGQTSVCACGQSLLIPTMLEMTRLELAPTDASTPSQRVWGWSHRMLLLGVTLLAAAIAGGFFLYCNRPIAPIDAIDPEALRRDADKLTPLQTWHYWCLMKQGLDRRTDQLYAARLTGYHIWQSVAGLTALGGLALIGAGMAIGKKQRGGDVERGRRGATPAM
jgi:hypothetical protein